MIYIYIYDTYIVKTYFGFNVCFSKLMCQDMYECYILNFSWIANQYDYFILAPQAKISGYATSLTFEILYSLLIIPLDVWSCVLGFLFFLFSLRIIGLALALSALCFSTSEGNIVFFWLIHFDFDFDFLGSVFFFFFSASSQILSSYSRLHLRFSFCDFTDRILSSCEVIL